MQTSQINIEQLIDNAPLITLAVFERYGRKKELKATPAMECLWVDYRHMSGEEGSKTFTNAYEAQDFYNSL